MPDQALLNQIAEKYGVAAGLIRDNPDIAALFDTAIAEKWAEDTTGQSQQKFMARLRETSWWKSNTDEWRKLAILKYNDPAEYALRFRTAAETFRREANKVGANQIDNKVRDQMINLAIQEGWDADRLDAELSKYVGRNSGGHLQGAAGSVEDQLKDTALRNGIRFSDDWYTNAAKSVLSQTKTLDDWNRWVRQQAANMYKGYADQIMSGMDLMDAASGLTNAVAEELELDPAHVQLADPVMQKALTNVDDKGQPAPMSLWQVRQMARQDDRFMRTQRAQREMAGIGSDILKAWGVWK